MTTSPSLAPGGELILTASCSSGKRLLSGGFTVTGGKGKWLAGTSGPSSDSQWEVALENVSATAIIATQIDVFAICGNVQ